MSAHPEPIWKFYNVPSCATPQLNKKKTETKRTNKHFCGFVCGCVACSKESVFGDFKGRDPKKNKKTTQKKGRAKAINPQSYGKRAGYFKRKK